MTESMFFDQVVKDHPNFDLYREYPNELNTRSGNRWQLCESDMDDVDDDIEEIIGDIRKQYGQREAKKREMEKRATR